MKLFVNKVKEELRVFQEKLGTSVPNEMIEIVKTISVYSFIMFLSSFFLINLWNGNLLTNFWYILFNFIGSGCAYYLFIDIMGFLIITIKAK